MTGSFIELDYTGRVDGVVFDTTRKADAPPNSLASFKPVVVKLGSGQLIAGLENFLKDKKAGKYSVSIPPESAFGKKDPKLLKLVPLASFKKEQQQQLAPGVPITVGDMQGVVKSVSGGRAVVDFNHQLAGKTVDYDIEFHGEVSDPKKKVESTVQAMLGVVLPIEKQGEDLVLSLPKGFPAEGLVKAIEEHTGVTIKTKEIEMSAASTDSAHNHSERPHEHKH